MLRTIILTCVSALLFTSLSIAADVSGKWTGQVPTRDGETREATFVFQVADGKLTGTMSGRQGDRPLVDGKATGDSILFTVDSPRGKQVYTGTVSGDEIKFKRQGAQGEPREFTAKRAK
jgi:hypothetical protein